MEETYPNNKEERKSKIKTWIFGIVILIVLFFVGLLYYNSQYINAIIGEETAKCIGGKCVLYVVEGCPHCQAQKAMFKDNIKYLNVTDCSIDRCPEILRVPTLICDNKSYEGYQDVGQVRRICTNG